MTQRVKRKDRKKQQEKELTKYLQLSKELVYREMFNIPATDKIDGNLIASIIAMENILGKL